MLHLYSKYLMSSCVRFTVQGLSFISSCIRRNQTISHISHCGCFALFCQCGICMCAASMFEEPVDIPCGHEFCRGCWERYWVFLCWNLLFYSVFNHVSHCSCYAVTPVICCCSLQLLESEDPGGGGP